MLAVVGVVVLVVVEVVVTLSPEQQPELNEALNIRNQCRREAHLPPMLKLLIMLMATVLLEGSGASIDMLVPSGLASKLMTPARVGAAFAS